jgi:kanamycin kinase
LIDDEGRFYGHVDLGDLGVADRWADLAIATLSLSWNYSGSWEGELFDAYGVDPDRARIDYYRRLWNEGDISSR